MRGRCRARWPAPAHDTMRMGCNQVGGVVQSSHPGSPRGPGPSSQRPAGRRAWRSDGGSSETTATERVMAKSGVLTVGGLAGQPLQVFLLTYVAYVTLYCGRKPLSVAKSAMGLPTATLGNMDTAFLAAYAFGQG